MKKIGDYTVRGQIASSDSEQHRIILFDGRFDTAYKVVGFEIANSDRDNTSSIVMSAKLLTEEGNDNTTWNWGKQDEIAWCSNAWDANGLNNRLDTHIDVDNLVVEDLFIGIYSSVAQDANYQIFLEKYDISDSQGALAMVRNRSQA